MLEPTADGPNDGVIASSAAFAATLRNAFAAGTPMPVSDYDGIDGLQPRNDLAGLNLTTVPKVLIECGNLRNASDAAVNPWLVYQTIIKKGRRFFRAPTRSLRDAPALAEEPKAVGPEGGRASRPPLLCRLGIQSFL